MSDARAGTSRGARARIAVRISRVGFGIVRFANLVRVGRHRHCDCAGTKACCECGATK